MTTTRRKFLSTAGAAGLASPWLSQSVRGAEKADRGGLPDSQAKLAKLNEVLRQPVLKKELFQNPVIIESVELATEWRERPLEETVDRIKQAVAEYDAKALKIKVLRYVI